MKDFLQNALGVLGVGALILFLFSPFLFLIGGTVWEKYEKEAEQAQKDQEHQELSTQLESEFYGAIITQHREYHEDVVLRNEAGDPLKCRLRDWQAPAVGDRWTIEVTWPKFDNQPTIYLKDFLYHEIEVEPAQEPQPVTRVRYPNNWGAERCTPCTISPFAIRK